MPRRTKDEIRIEREVDAAMRRYSRDRLFNIRDITKIFAAGEAAGKAGQSIDAAVLDASIKYDLRQQTA